MSDIIDSVCRRLTDGLLSTHFGHSIRTFVDVYEGLGDSNHYLNKSADCRAPNSASSATSSTPSSRNRRADLRDRTKRNRQRKAGGLLLKVPATRPLLGENLILDIDRHQLLLDRCRIHVANVQCNRVTV